MRLIIVSSLCITLLLCALAPPIPAAAGPAGHKTSEIIDKLNPSYKEAEWAYDAYIQALAKAPFGTAQHLAMDALYASALRTGYDQGDKLAIKTDRFHSYEHYLSTHLLPMRLQPVRFLEIGLGCNMAYGAGRSLKLWVDLLPAAQIWMAESNEECLSAKAKEIATLAPGRVNLLVGSQDNPEVLARWRQQANSSSDATANRGPWHFIIDDGSHVATHQWLTLVELWPMLAPGGVFAVEDMGETRQVANTMHWKAGGLDARTGVPTFMAAVNGIIADLVDNGGGVSKRTNERLRIAPSPHQLHRVLPQLKAVQCFAESCVFIKCLGTERRCP